MVPPHLANDNLSCNPPQLSAKTYYYLNFSYSLYNFFVNYLLIFLTKLFVVCISFLINAFKITKLFGTAVSICSYIKTTRLVRIAANCSTDYGALGSVQ